MAGNPDYPDEGYGRGLTDALRRLRDGERRKPTDADRPPVSTFKMTPAARAARRMDKAKR